MPSLNSQNGFGLEMVMHKEVEIDSFQMSSFQVLLDPISTKPLEIEQKFWPLNQNH